MIVDLALSPTGSQLIASVLPNVSTMEYFGELLRLITSTAAGGQGPACTIVRIDSGTHRHSPWLQDWLQSHLAVVSVHVIRLTSVLLTSL